MKSGVGENANGATSQRLLVVGDTTLDPLARMLERSPGTPRLQACAAPYGQVYQILLDGNHSAWAFQPDILMVWTAPHLTLPSLGKLLRFEFYSAAAVYESALREAEQFADAVLQAASRVGQVFVPTWMLPSHERWIQTLAWREGMGLANLLARTNLILAEKFAARTNIVLLDAGYWQASLRRPAHDFRMYAVAKILYSQNLFEKAAAEMKAVLRGSLGHGKKVIVCDLDNTLWGGG